MDRKLMIGAAVALGALMIVPGVASAVARAARPAVKAALKTSLLGYREVQRAGMEIYETAEDALAEVEQELAERQSPAPSETPERSNGSGNGGDL